MRNLRFTPLTGLLVLAAFAAPVAAAPDARAISAPPALARSNHDAAIDAALAVVEADPNSPLVPAAILRIEGSLPFATKDEPSLDRVLAVIRAGVENGENDEMLRRHAWDRLRKRGDLKASAALDPDAGYLREFAVVGPFGFAASALLDRRYEPEERLDFERPYRELTETRRFRKLPPRDGRYAAPFSVLDGAGGVAYAVAQVRSETDRAVVLKIESSASIRAWWNHEQVLRVDRLRERRPHAAYVPVVLKAGWNRLVLKTAGNGPSFAVKIVESASLRPVRGLTEEAGLTLQEVASHHPKIELPPPPAPASRELAGMDDPYAVACCGMLVERDGLDLEAISALERAIEKAPEDPGLRYLLGSHFANASGLPEVWRKNQAKLAYGAALERDPDYFPATVALAVLKHADDRSEEAMADLRAVLAKNPGDVAARWALVSVAAGRGWENEALEAARTLAGQAPRFRPALLHLARYEEQYGDVAEARKWLEQALAAHQDDYDLLRRLGAFDAAEGDLETAIARQRRIAEFWPNYAGAPAEIARHIEALGRYDEALALFRRLADDYPENSTWPRRIGDLLRRKGDSNEAIRAYEESLARDRGQPDLRRRIARMTGAPEDLWGAYDVEVRNLIPSAPGREEHPNAPAIVLLDQTILRVWPDGSSTSWVHMAYKILDDKGVEAFGRVETAGETQEIRTIDPEGRIWEPIGVSGNSYNMPALAPGAVVEYRFRADSPAGDRSFDTGPFYFADPDFDQPVLLSRWIVVLPADFDADLLLRNFDGRHETRTENGLVIHVFEKENAPRIEREPFMPDRDDLLPWARFLRNRPFEDVGYLHADRLWSGLAPTPLVQKTARDVLAGENGGAAAGDDIEIARRIHAYVNDLVVGDFSFGGPTATIIEKAGDRFDLFASMLDAAGVPFELGLAAPDRGRHAEWDVVNPGYFSHRCLRILPRTGVSGLGIDLPPSPTWVFDAPRLAPFGRIPDSLHDSPVLVIGRTGGRIETLPAGPEADRMPITTSEIVLGEGRGDVRTTLTLDVRSDQGFGLKDQLQKYDADDRRQLIESWMSSIYTGPQVEAFDLPRLAETGTPATLVGRARLPNFLQADGDGARCGFGFRPLNLAGTYVGKPERIHPMEIESDGAQADRVVIDLGQHWRVASLPEDHVTAGPLGWYSLTIRESGTKLVVERRVRLRPARLSKSEYPALVEWVKAIDQAEVRKIRLIPR